MAGRLLIVLLNGVACCYAQQRRAIYSISRISQIDGISMYRKAGIAATAKLRCGVWDSHI